MPKILLARYLVLTPVLLASCIPSDTSPDRGGVVVEVIPESEVYRTDDGWEVTLESIDARVSLYTDQGSSYDEGSHHWDSFAPFSLVQRGISPGATGLTINIGPWQDSSSDRSFDESVTTRTRQFVLQLTARRASQTARLSIQLSTFYASTMDGRAPNERTAIVPANAAARLRCALSFRELFVQADGRSIVPTLIALDSNSDGIIDDKEGRRLSGFGGFSSADKPIPFLAIRWLD
jgi:hypothetical protein